MSDEPVIAFSIAINGGQLQHVVEVRRIDGEPVAVWLTKDEWLRAVGRLWLMENVPGYWENIEGIGRVRWGDWASATGST